MIFNIASSVDILPELKINNENILEVVEEMKLLGIVIQSNLKWKSNTSNLTKKGWRRMWLLRNEEVRSNCSKFTMNKSEVCLKWPVLCGILD